MGVIGDEKEWIVEVNDEDNLVRKIDREVAHKIDSLKLHREAMTLLYLNTSHDNFLLQHRSDKKKQWPGYWTLSVTGHVDFADISISDNEGYLTASKRESKEEIGVEVNKLELVGKIIQKHSKNWSMMGIVIGEYDGEFILEPEEVSEVKIFSKDAIIEVSDKLTPGARQCLIYLGILSK